MSNAMNTYRHAGAMGSALIVVPLVGIVAGLVLSVVYAYISVYSPIGGYVSILLVVGFGFVIGLVNAVATKWAKCRNTTLAAVLGSIVGLFALYSAWVLFLFVLLRRSDFPIAWSDLPTLFFSPVGCWNLVLEINKEGWYTIGNSTPTGIVLWAFWAIEAVVIIAMAGYLSSSAITGEVFCERCHKWVDNEDEVRLALPTESADVSRVASGDFDILCTLPPSGEYELPHLVVETKQCDECRNMATYQVKLVDEQTDKDGKTELTAVSLTGVLFLSAEDLDRLLDLSSRPAPDFEDHPGEDVVEDTDEGEEYL